MLIAIYALVIVFAISSPEDDPTGVQAINCQASKSEACISPIASPNLIGLGEGNSFYQRPEPTQNTYTAKELD